MCNEDGGEPRVILVAGPTGSGKSRLAMGLAQARDGVVINADSMQVYRQLRVLTARPSISDEAGVAHRLYGHIDLAQSYSVGMWLEDVVRVIEEVRGQGRMPIVVGGTGLYFRALTEGLAPVPEIPVEVRAHWRREGEARAAEDLHATLESLDSEMARRLRPSDAQRIVRALEVIEGTGRSLCEWQRRASPPFLPPGRFKGLVVERPRAEIYRSCELRFDEMIQGGGLEEARFVRDMQLDPALPGMRAVGLRPLLAHFDGELSLEEAVLAGKRDTRHYVKRQLTWLRRNMIAWTNVLAKDTEGSGLKSFAFIDD